MEATPHTAAIVAWCAFALAFIFGAVGNKVSFCTMGAVSDLVNIGDWGRMRMWLLSIAVAIIGAQTLQLLGLVDLSKSIYTTPNFTWLSFVVGGFLFGVGMTLGSGCGSKTLIRVGAGNLKSLEKIKEWADKGYLGQGDAFNARNDSEAAAAFGRGSGAFVLGGNWNASIAKDGLGKNAAFFDMPPGSGGKAIAIGSTSTPLHISAKSKQPDLAAAYLDFITGPTAGKALVDTQQVPAATDATAKPGDPLGKEVIAGWQKLVNDGGLTLYPDWSSPTMLQTMGQSFQEMLAGRTSPQDVVSRVQKDWEEYDKELQGS